MNTGVDMISLAVGILLEKSKTLLGHRYWLLVTDEWLPAYQTNWVRLVAVEHKSDSSVVNQSVIFRIANWLIFVTFWYMCTYNGDGLGILTIKVITKMLIQRGLCMLKKLVQQYWLSLDILFFTSNRNLTDKLTWVPQRLNLFHHYMPSLWMN